jgi:lipoprotein-anchoring transpeptidase ErfK/SrfK
VRRLFGGRHLTLAVAAFACLALPASVSARLTEIPSATWTAPTPPEGKRFTPTVGRELVFTLAATAPGGPPVDVSISAAGLPAGAAFQPVTGNPGSATVAWKPRRTQAGRTFAVKFTAQPTTPAIAPATRRVQLHVAKPRPRKRPRPKRFTLSSQKQELFRYAFVIRATVARSAPRKTAAAVAALARWTPEGTTNLVQTLEGRRTRRGVWIKVRLPILPANRTGWVHRKSLSDWKEVRTRLVVDRRQLTATLYRRGKLVFRAPVGVGVSHWPTPRGEFFIRNQLYGFGNPVYGPIAFGTSARSAVLTDWPGGGFIGIHGTNQPHLLPGRVSHGCIRMKNGHILRLAKLMPVGSPLSVL